MLRYRGPLSANNTRAAKEKEHLRLYFHGQLLELCKREPESFGYALTENLQIGKLVGRRVSLEHSYAAGSFAFFAVPIAGHQYVPLVTRVHNLNAALDIVWLRQESPGSFVNDGGDLDNRLKNLLDALRMPHSEQEVPDEQGDLEPRIYCLLEDDSLIARLSVTTHHLLDAVTAGHENEIELLIHVTVSATTPGIGNAVSGFVR